MVMSAGSHHRPWDNLGTIPMHRAMARIAFHESPQDFAAQDAHFETCFPFGESHRHLPLAVVARFRFAEFLHARGETGPALQQLALADSAFTRLDMPWWREQPAALRGRIEARQSFRGFAPYLDG